MAEEEWRWADATGFSTLDQGRPSSPGERSTAPLNGADSKTAALTNWFWTWMRHDRPSRVLIHPDEED